MAKPTDRYAALRTRLIDVAERTVAARGLDAVKARDLAAEAECAIGTIYNVFEHLDELVLCVGARTLAMLDSALRAARSTQPYGSPEEAVADLVQLALAYLDFAARHRVRWRALFEHRLSDGHSLPEWYVEQQHLLFAQVEGPLAALLPDLDDDQRRVLARTLFSAVHGVVALGLEEKLISLPLPNLRAQVAAVVRAIAKGRDELRNGSSV
ncbi:MAG: TetR/AcrR family transcriptional regulator [Alphaproteobacteria bacterium]|nr:TetR/AcrR family transcriptional regulator [Alphaproteobacteria bacterium]